MVFKRFSYLSLVGFSLSVLTGCSKALHETPVSGDYIPLSTVPERPSPLDQEAIERDRQDLHYKHTMSSKNNK